jgi:putative phosphoribosyl transferase
MIQLPFQNRLEAGRALATELQRRNLQENAVVLALARGGVPVGFEVADRLTLPFDVLVVRKIPVPWQPELAMGAIAGEVRILDRELIQKLNVPEEDLEAIIADEAADARRREDLYREILGSVDVRGKIALLVDDGLATGSTMIAAARHIRSLGPERTVIAVPVGSKDSCRRTRTEVDDLVCLAIPDCFYAVGEWYRNFEQVSDECVRSLLLKSRRGLDRKLAAHSVYRSTSE